MKHPTFPPVSTVTDRGRQCNRRLSKATWPVALGFSLTCFSKDERRPGFFAEGKVDFHIVAVSWSCPDALAGCCPPLFRIRDAARVPFRYRGMSDCCFSFLKWFECKQYGISCSIRFGVAEFRCFCCGTRTLH
jgi:hypothetical protein